MTGQRAIELALLKLGVIAKGDNAESVELEDGLVMLNSLLATWKGLPLMLPVGSDVTVFNPLSAVTVTIPLPVSYDIAIVYCMALLMAPDYGKQVSNEFAAVAVNSIRMIKQKKSMDTIQEPMQCDYGCPGILLSTTFDINNY